MTPNEYQQLADRTKAPQDRVLGRIGGLGDKEKGVQLLHAVMGLTGEVGELAGAYEKFAYYDQTLDETNIKEELGDCLWYIAEACNALGISLQEVMEANIRKLRLRYPEKYDNTRAQEENRDRETERKTMWDEEVVALEGKVITAQMIPNQESLDNLLYRMLSDKAEKIFNQRKQRAEDDGVDYDAE